MNLSAKDKARFWAKVDRTGNCWLWTAAVDKDGYGFFKVYPKMVRAHRVSYEIAHGPIAPGVKIDHTCHTPSCVNPSHLRPATNKQNGENRRGAQRNSETGVRGVYPNRNRKSGGYRATVFHEGKTVHVGVFDDIESAGAAVSQVRESLFTHSQEPSR